MLKTYERCSRTTARASGWPEVPRPLIERLERGEFDLVAVGRTLIVNPEWPNLVRQGAFDQLRPYTNESLMRLE